MMNFAEIGNIRAQAQQQSPLQTKKTATPVAATPLKPSFSGYSSENIKAYAPAFSSSLRSKDEQLKYNEISKYLDSQNRTYLNSLLKTGVLLDQNSNDKSTVLDNLYSIATQPRIKGIDNGNVLKETIKAIANPFTITQNFGDIPTPVAQDLMTSATPQPLTSEDLNVRSASCVATSIEFNMAQKQPAEFTRMVSGLSSENYSVKKTLKLSDIASNTVDAIWMLNEFNSDYKLNNWNEVEINMHPDRNAIIRARIQNSYKDSQERSLVDVLMQSTFMNIGSQNTYDSLTDTRYGKFNPDNRGLTDIEKNFTEEVAQGRPKVSVTYQKLDEDGKLIGYECDAKTVQKHILDALKLNNNVIIGYTQMDESNKVINGHEITIIGAEQAPDGRINFICNDTDDNQSEPIKWSADELIPLIHHAGLPQEVLKNDVEFTDSWREVMEMYKNEKETPQIQPNQQV
ncbi:MAG: hypothetical protein PHV37_01620 [Candidatus Gastranaerophilales bacterium]|nr:hypothetical protein [Candidatus Gastranaerophilales bacterium]